MGTVRLTQFVYPFGSREEIEVDLPDEVCEMAKEQVLSCECMPNNYSQVVFYSRKSSWKEEHEECYIAKNGPGKNSPKNTLERLIRFVNKHKVAPQELAEAAEQQPTNATSSASLQPTAH